MSDGLIETYDEVRRYFISNPESQCVDLFLRSFGEGSGFGVYQLVDEALRQYPQAEVAVRLAVHLKDPVRSIRYWCTEMAASFSDPVLVEPLSDLLKEQDIDIRSATLTALFTIPEMRITSILQSALAKEADPELWERINDAIQSRKRQNLES